VRDAKFMASDPSLAALPRPDQRTFRWKVRRAVARMCQARWQGGEGRPDDLPVADRQARTHCAQAQGREAVGAGAGKSGRAIIAAG
jgi:hypothetical protein